MFDNTFIQDYSCKRNKSSATNFFNPVVQPKLTINNPNDAYEKEADAMADKVMRMEQPFIQAKPIPITQLQRKCTHCEEEEKQAQRKEINNEQTTAGNNLENYIGALNGGGQPLPNEVRNFYEPRFGYNFSNVKVHTDSVAAKSAQSINALAYTTGNNIVFNSGQYDYNNDNGKKLLGHELTHVVQQNGGLPKTVQRTIGDGHDLQADRFRLDEKLEQAFDGEYIFKHGATGEAVIKLQQALIDRGYNLSQFGADGIYGNETTAAVRDFQKSKGLSFAETDGMVGPQTMGLLDEEFANEQPIIPPNNLPECPMATNNTSNAFELISSEEQTANLIPGITCQVPGPGKNKPSKKCSICGPASTAVPQTLTIGTNVFVLCPCDTGQKKFNTGPGHVDQGIKTDSETKLPTIDKNKLVFKTGFQGQNVANNTPAWDYSGSVALQDESIPPGGSSRLSEVGTGFIQTLEFYKWDAKYTNGWERNLSEANKIDQLPSPNTPPVPWQNGETAVGNLSILADEPSTSLSVTHPDPNAKCAKLNEVFTEGKFNLWLIGAESANATTNLVFLFNASIEFKRSFSLTSPDADPSSSLNWVAAGSQTEVSTGFGKGSKTPVLSQPLPALTFTTKNGNTCLPEKK